MTSLERGIFGGFILTLAAVTYLLSSSLYDRSVAAPIDILPTGRLSVVTDDPKAVVALNLYSSSGGFGDVADAEDAPLALDISITSPSKRRELAFAIVMEGDAALPHGGELSGSALPRGGRRGPEDVWVQGHLAEAWFMIEAGFTSLGGEIPPPPVSSVLVGRALRSPSESSFMLKVVGPTHGELYFPAPDGFEFYFPELTTPKREFVYGENLTVAGDDQSTPAAALDLLTKTSWHPPAEMSSEVELFDLRANDRVLAIPNPTSIVDSHAFWRGKDHLEVRGIIERRVVIQQRQRAQFLAGALVGLSGGLLVWGFEVLLPLGIGFVKNRSRRPNPPGDTAI